MEPRLKLRIILLHRIGQLEYRKHRKTLPKTAHVWVWQWVSCSG